MCYCTSDINAIVKTLVQVYIKFPTGQSLKIVVKDFEEKGTSLSVLVPLKAVIYQYANLH